MTKNKKIVKTIRLVYVGCRLFSNDKLVAAFVAEDEKDKLDKSNYHFFKTSKKYYIGSIYLADQYEDKTYSIKSLNEDYEAKDRPQDIWSRMDIAAKEMRKDIVAREKIAKNPLKKSEIEFLKKYVKGMSWRETDAFIKYLVREVITR